MKVPLFSEATISLWTMGCFHWLAYAFTPGEHFAFMNQPKATGETDESGEDVFPQSFERVMP